MNYLMLTVNLFFCYLYLIRNKVIFRYTDEENIDRDGNQNEAGIMIVFIKETLLYKI